MLLERLGYWVVSGELCLLRRQDIVMEKDFVISGGGKQRKSNELGQLHSPPVLSEL